MYNNFCIAVASSYLNVTRDYCIARLLHSSRRIGASSMYVHNLSNVRLRSFVFSIAALFSL